MNRRVKKLSSVAALVVLLAAGACSRPDEDPPVRITGDPTGANPGFITSTTSTTEPRVTTTTIFWAPNGPGGSMSSESTEPAESEADESAETTAGGAPSSSTTSMVEASGNSDN